MRNILKMLASFVLVTIIFTGCEKNYTDSPTSPNINTASVRARISFGMSQSLDSLHNFDVSTVVDSVLTNRLISFYGGRSTGTIIWYQHAIIHANGTVDSAGGTVLTGLWYNRTFSQVEDVTYRLRVYGNQGPNDTSSAYISPLHILDHFGGGGSGQFAELSFVNIGTMYPNGMVPFNLSCPKDRTQFTGNTSGAMIDITESWMNNPMTSQSGTAWFGPLIGYEGDKYFQYTGNAPTNWMSFTVGSAYRNVQLPDTNRYYVALRTTGMYFGGTGPTLAPPGQTGDPSMTTGSLRWELLMGVAGPNQQDTVNFYFNDGTIPTMISMLNIVPECKYKINSAASYTTQSQVMSPGKRWGKLTLIRPHGSGSTQFRLQFDCNNIDPAYKTQSIAWFPSEFCFLVTIVFPQ